DDRRTVLQHEHIDRTQAEHHQRVTVEPVGGPHQPGAGPVLLDREGVDRAQGAAVEIAGGGVVNGVGAAPVVVGRGGEHADDASGPGVGGGRTEEGGVSAVVL